MRLLAVAFSLLLLFTSTAHAAGHGLSEWNKKECVEMRLVTKRHLPPPPGTPPDSKALGTLVIGAGLNVAIPMVVSFVKKRIKESALKYTGSYGASITGTDFFHPKVDNQKADLVGIELTRYATHEGVPSDNPREKTSFVSLALKRDKRCGAFSFTVSEAKVRYAKCKIDRWETSREDTKFPHIDLKVTVSIQCFWQDWHGDPRSMLLGAVTIPVNNVPVTGASLTKPSRGSRHPDGHCSGESDRIVSWFPPFPINYYADGHRNDVAYVLNVTVNEFDDYAALVKKYGDFLGGASDIAQAMALKLIEQITTPEE